MILDQFGNPAKRMLWVHEWLIREQQVIAETSAADFRALALRLSLDVPPVGMRTGQTVHVRLPKRFEAGA